MKSLNKVTLIGHLGKDPEVQRFDSGAVKAAFSLATSESYLNRDGVKIENTEWHNVVMWRGLAEIAEKYLRKGSPVYIEGRIKTRSWEDKDGNKRYTTEIEARDLIMLGGRNDNPNMGGNNNSYQQNTQAQKPAPVVAETSIDEADDLPF